MSDIVVQLQHIADALLGIMFGIDALILIIVFKDMGGGQK